MDHWSFVKVTGIAALRSHAVNRTQLVVSMPMRFNDMPGGLLGHCAPDSLYTCGNI